jgi:hypothetical protein
MGEVQFANLSLAGLDLPADLCANVSALMKQNKSNAQFTQELVEYYLSGICGMTICCFGIVGNILSLIVLTRRSMRSSSTYIYLSTLSICDMLVLLFTMMLLTKDTVKPDKTSSGDWVQLEGTIYPYMFPYVHPLCVTLQVISIWLTLAFTTDRYIMICHPFQAEKMCTRSRARKVILGLSISGFILHIPRFFEYETLLMPGICTQRIWYTITEFGWSPIYREIFHSYFYMIFVCGVPFIALAVMNCFLIYAVHLSRKRGREINAAERKRNDTTVMLIGVIVVFFTCQVPALISRVLWAVHNALDQSPELHILNEVGNFLVILNSAINIVPYYFFGQRFRREFWNTFCCCVCGRERVQQMNYNSAVYTTDGRKYSNGSLLTTNSEDIGRKSSHSVLITQPLQEGPSTMIPMTNIVTNPTFSHQELNGNYKETNKSDISVPLISVPTECNGNTSGNTSDVML